MATVQFTAHLVHQVGARACTVPGATVRAVMDAVFAEQPAVRSYVLDDQNEVRQHVVIFADGITLRDRRGLTDTVQPDSDIFVMQALSGG